MRKLLPLLVAAVAVVSNAARAEVIVLDDFKKPDPSVRMIVVNNGGGTYVNQTCSYTSFINNSCTNSGFVAGDTATTTANDTTPIVSSRTVSVKGTGSTTGSTSTVTIGSNVGGAELSVDNGPSANSEVALTWTINPNTPISVDTFGSLFLSNSTSDLTIAGVMTIAINNIATPITFASQTIVSGSSWALTQADINAIFANGATLQLTLSGPLSYDITLKDLNITIPEPTSLALTGLALVGAGFAARRRKAA